MAEWHPVILGATPDASDGVARRLAFAGTGPQVQTELYRVRTGPGNLKFLIEIRTGRSNPGQRGRYNPIGPHCPSVLRNITGHLPSPPYPPPTPDRPPNHLPRPSTPPYVIHACRHKDADRMYMDATLHREAMHIQNSAAGGVPGQRSLLFCARTIARSVEHESANSVTSFREP